MAGEQRVEDLFRSFAEQRAPVRFSGFLKHPPNCRTIKQENAHMASLSLKLLAVGAAISIGAILGANTSNAAPLAASSAVVELGGAPLVQVDYRYGPYRPPYRPAACMPGQAASKASRMGIRDPRVSVNRNVVRVSGWKRGLRTALVFARAPGCPIIR
jgi:hypothetical protein